MRKFAVSLLSLTLLASGAMAAGIASASAAPSSQVVSMRRLTQAEYRNSIADIFGKEIEVRGSFEPTIRVGGLQAASTAVLSVTPVGFESFTNMADSIAVQVTGEKYRAKLPCTPKIRQGARRCLHRPGAEPIWPDAVPPAFEPGRNQERASS